MVLRFGLAFFLLSFTAQAEEDYAKLAREFHAAEKKYWVLNDESYDEWGILAKSIKTPHQLAAYKSWFRYHNNSDGKGYISHSDVDERIILNVHTRNQAIFADMLGTQGTTRII